jgi:hypothetical protein
MQTKVSKLQTMLKRFIAPLLMVAGISVADELSFALSPAQNELAEKVTQKTMELN